MPDNRINAKESFETTIETGTPVVTGKYKKYLHNTEDHKETIEPPILINRDSKVSNNTYCD